VTANTKSGQRSAQRQGADAKRAGTTLLEAFDTLPADEKEVLTVAILAHAKAQGLPVDLIVRHALRQTSANSTPPLSASARVKELREWAESHPITTPLSDEAISRKSLYAERG